MRLVYLLLSLFSVGAALKSFLEDSLGDYCHECEYPHFIGPRPDPFTTLSCIHQVMPETPRVRVQYMLREHPICITMLVFDGLMPVYQIRTGVPASSLPSKCYEYREKGGYYIPDLTMNITVSEGVQLDWQSEKDNPQNFHDFIALRLHGEGPNKEFTGAVMCCGTTLCNADDVEFYLPTRISQGYEREADWRRSMPFVLVIAVLAITLWPHLTKVQEENRVTALEKIERAMVLSDDWFGFPAPVCILHPDAEAVSAKFYPPMTERALRRIRAEKGCRDKEARDYAAFRRLQAVLRGLEKAPPRARDSSISENVNVQPPTAIHTFFIDDTVVCKTIRRINTRVKDLAARLIEHGPYEFEFSVIEVADLFDDVIRILENDHMLLELPADIIVIGNLNGDYAQLFRIFNKCGWLPDRKYLFLGGLTDPKVRYSLETLCLLLALKRRFPQQIFFLRGTTETEGLVVKHRMGFPERLANVVKTVSKEVHARFPVAAIIAGRIFCVHGGIPPHLSLSSIRARPKGNATVKDSHLEASLIFSLPDAHRTNKIPGGRGWRFGPDVISSFFRKNPNLKAMIRARNPVDSGLQVSKCEEYPVYTVSSQMLQKRGVRSGCILYVSPGGIEAARFTSHDQHPDRRAPTAKEAETWMDRTAHGWPRRGSAVPRSYDTSKEEKDGEKKGNKASA